MTVTDRVVQQLNARRVREGEFRAKCPVHQGKSDTSMSIKDAGDRVLIHCHQGCSFQDILSALGMKSAAELFESVHSKPDPILQQRAKARRDLERWAQGYLVIVAGFLRDIDGAIRLATGILKQYEDGTLKRDPEAEEGSWSLLGKAYKLQTDYEWQFEVLNGKDLQLKLNLWRELTQ